jgi:hypothetical protein
MYHHFYSSGINPCSANDGFFEQAKQTWLCPGCYSPKPGVGIVNIKVDDDKPDDRMMTMVFGIFVPIVEWRFLNYLPQDLIKREFWIGQVLGPNDKPMENWITARCRSQIIIRGVSHAGMRRCTECGRTVYFGGGNRYLSPAPPAGHDIHESHLCGFVLPDRLMQAVNIPKLRGVIHEKLKVRVPAPDGFGELPWRVPMA